MGRASDKRKANAQKVLAFRYFEDARIAFFESSDHIAASKLLALALQENPIMIEALYLKGVIHDRLLEEGDKRSYFELATNIHARSYSEHYYQLNAAYALGKYQEAVKHSDFLFTKYISHADSSISLISLYEIVGLSYYRTHQYIEAKRILSNIPKNKLTLEVADALSEILCSQQNYKKAIEYLTFVASVTKTSESYNRLGEAHTKLSSPREALSYFNQSISCEKQKAQPDDFKILLLEAKIALCNADIAILTKIKISTDTINITLGNAYSKLGDYAAAYKAYNKVDRIMDASNIVLSNLTKTLYMLKKYDKAKPFVDLLLILNPNDLFGNATLGQLAFQQKDYRKAIGHFKNALLTEETIPELGHALIKSMINLYKTEEEQDFILSHEALVLCRIYNAPPSLLNEAIMNYADSLVKDAKYREAFTTYSEITSSSKLYADSLYMRAFLLFKDGDIRNGKSILDKAVKASKNIKDAITLFYNATTLFEDTSIETYHFGCILFQRKEYVAAMKAYKKCPEDLNVLESIGDTYRAMGQTDEALISYKQANSTHKVASTLSMLANNTKNLTRKISLYEEALEYNPHL